MAKRRANNEGTIYQKANGKWRAQIGLNGQRLSYTGKTQKECQDWLKRTIRQKDEGYNYRSAQTTLGQFLAEWLVRIESSRSASTMRMYRATIENEIVPRIGRLKLKDLSPEHIQRLYDLRIASGGTPYTIKRIHKVLHCSLKQAVKLGLLVRNPASVVTIPRLVQKEMSSFTEEQVQRFLDKAMFHQLYAFFYLAIHTGMRKSELLGLQWEDLDWERNTLQVQRQLRWKKGGYVLDRPKTQKSIRTITLGETAMEVLKAHQIDNQLSENGLIFTTENGKSIRDAEIYKEFKGLIEEAGVPMIRFHDLRHTAASIMLNYGIPVIIVSRRLGHSKPSITLDVYGHLIPSRQEEAANLMDELMNAR